MAFSNYSISRTQPVPLGVQPASKSIPVVITNDEGITLNVKESQPATEVALSLLGIPRAETALGVFADITTYGIDPNIWTATPLLYRTDIGTGIRFLQNQSAASIEAANNNWAALNTNRAFPYLPGRVSSGTFGVRHKFAKNNYAVDGLLGFGDNPIRKWGCFNDKDGYYFEIQGEGNTSWTMPENPDLGLAKFHVVRRTSGIPRSFFFENYSNTYTEPFTNYAAATVIDSFSQTITLTDPLSVPYMIVVDSLSCFHAALHDPRLRTTREETTSAVQISFIYNGQERTYYVNPANAFVYEYRVPREWFGFDKVDGLIDTPVYYSDVVTVNGITRYPGDPTGKTDTSVHAIDFSKTTMYKIEYSWYGAVGALFLAYVPVDSGDARWVRLHHLRGSNQLSVPTLGNPYLPITYFVWNSGANTESVEKYGASYYIDGAEKGSVKVFSAFSPTKNIDTGYIPYPGAPPSLPTRIEITNDTTNTSLFLETANLVPRLVTTGTIENIFNSFHMGAYLEGTIYYKTPLNTVQTVEFTPGKYFITDIKVQRPTNGANTSVDVLTGIAFLNAGVIPVTDWQTLTADIKFLLPRSTPLLNIQMKPTVGLDKVANKVTVFPNRLNVGLDLPDNVYSGQVQLIKNPVYAYGLPSFGGGPSLINYYNTAISITLSADATISSALGKTEIYLNLAPGIRNNQNTLIQDDHYLNEGFKITGYLQGIPGVLTREKGKYYFERVQEGRVLTLSGGETPILNVTNDSRGLDQFVVDPGFTTNGIIGQPGFSQDADSFSAITYNVASDTMPLVNTGNTIVSFAASKGGSDYDLSSFFDFNREFLAGAGLSTGTILQEQLTVTGRVFNPDEIIRGGSSGNAIVSLTWEEQ